MSDAHGTTSRRSVSVLDRARTLLRSNAAIYLLGAIASRLGAIVLIPLYTRRLTPADYGEYSLALSVLALVPIVASLGLNVGMARVFFDTPDRELGRRSLGAVARGMFVVSTALVLLLVLAVTLFVPERVVGIQRNHLLLVLVAGAGTAWASAPDLLFRASQQPKRAVALQLSTFLLSAGCGVAFVLGLGRGLTGALEAPALGFFVIGAFAVGFILFGLPSGDVLDETRRALKVSLPIIPHYIALWLQTTADRWVLTAFGASASLGAYYLATQILSPIPMITSAWNDAEAPRLGELFRKEGAAGTYRALPRTARNYFLITLVPTIGLVAASPLLPLVIGPKFLGAIAALPLLAVAALLDSQYSPASNYLFYVGRTRLIPVITVAASVVGVGLSIALLPRFGLVGLLISRVVGSLVRVAVAALAVWIARPSANVNAPPQAP